MDSLTIFGLLAVTAMLIFYALEDRNPLPCTFFALQALAHSVRSMAFFKAHGRSKSSKLFGRPSRCDSGGQKPGLGVPGIIFRGIYLYPPTIVRC